MTEILLGGDWALHDATGRPVADCPIPGDIHSALIDAGQIPDPMIGTNENAVQWVGDAVWEIRRTFTVPATSLAGKWAVIDLEFVDTFADVLVNGQAVGQTETSFRRHRIDVTEALRPGDNEIAIRFHPAATEAHARAARLPFPVPWSVSNNRIADMNVIRKAQCHAGWDWGLCLMLLGIYAEPRLCLFDAARIEHFVVRQDHADDGVVIVTAEVELAAWRDAMVPVTFAFDDRTVSADVAVTAASGGSASLTLEVRDPELWWPAGHGAQPLMTAQASIPGDTATRRIGLRKLELINQPDAVGMSLVVRVNGVDMFMKGANWIPADALPSRITPERTRRLLGEAQAANMNMIRVWGGGFYEFDAFYDACDELGLLVWQDLMFSCSQYPSTPDFLAEVDREVRYQVRRLASHPSIALWCGDNEVIGSLTWYEASRTNRDRYLVNYDRFNRAVEVAVTESDPDRFFWPSSPCSGALDYGDAWHDDSKGDMHFWAVWHEGRDFEHYFSVKPRFCSEFGFQSFPTMTAIRRFAEPSQWNAMSPVMEHHQRDGSGNGKIVETMTRYFRSPTSFENFVYLSQLQQALAIETAVRYWRSLKPRCMGTLYWQLNDVWPSVSWSSIDHALAWKALHYHARRFYAPTAVAVRFEDGRLVISGIHDGRDAVELEVRVRRVGLDGSLLEEATVEAAIPADLAVEIGRFDAPGTDGFFVLDARTAGARTFDPLMQLAAFPDKPKRYELPPATVAVESVGGGFRFSVDASAFFVMPEAPGFSGAFDDASFLLLPGEDRVVGFRSFDDRMPEAGDLVTTHLATTYS
ncbi:MAG: glycoside hydrolase family 2 protein [Bauldia litoralis]